MTPLLNLVPLNADECLQISSEQDAPDYMSSVINIIRKGNCLLLLDGNFPESEIEVFISAAFHGGTKTQS